MKYPGRIINEMKVFFSILFCRNAKGRVLPPYILHIKLQICIENRQKKVQRMQDTTDLRVDGLIAIVFYTGTAKFKSPKWSKRNHRRKHIIHKCLFNIS